MLPLHGKIPEGFVFYEDSLGCQIINPVCSNPVEKFKGEITTLASQRVLFGSTLAAKAAVGALPPENRPGKSRHGRREGQGATRTQGMIEVIGSYTIDKDRLYVFFYIFSGKPWKRQQEGANIDRSVDGVEDTMLQERGESRHFLQRKPYSYSMLVTKWHNSIATIFCIDIFSLEKT